MICNTPTDICFSFEGFRTRGRLTDAQLPDPLADHEKLITLAPGTLTLFHEDMALHRESTAA